MIYSMREMPALFENPRFAAWIAFTHIYKASLSGLLFSECLICRQKLNYRAATDCSHTFISAFHFFLRAQKRDLLPTNQSEVKQGALRDYLLALRHCWQKKSFTLRADVILLHAGCLLKMLCWWERRRRRKKKKALAQQKWWELLASADVNPARVHWRFLIKGRMKESRGEPGKVAESWVTVGVCLRCAVRLIVWACAGVLMWGSNGPY